MTFIRLDDSVVSCPLATWETHEVSLHEAIRVASGVALDGILFRSRLVFVS
jgi:hypothetical protein